MTPSIETYLLLAFVLSVGGTIGALAVVCVVLVRLPADYFSAPAARPFLAGRHPLIRRTGMLLKNLSGVVLATLGVVLSLPGIPGPGILTLLVGVMLIDFPEKRRLERWLIGRPMILRTTNRLRRRYGQAPLA